MRKITRKAIKRFSLHSKDSGKPEKRRKRRPRPAYKRERWLYGFHLKNQHIRRIAEKYGLDWEDDTIDCMFRVPRHIKFASNVFYTFRGIVYRGRPAGILTFLEDDGRKRLERNEFTQKEMDKVRRVMGLPKGTKPKWFNLADYYGEDADYSSSEESLPPIKGLACTPTVRKSNAAPSHADVQIKASEDDVSLDYEYSDMSDSSEESKDDGSESGDDSGCDVEFMG